MAGTDEIFSRKGRILIRNALTLSGKRDVSIDANGSIEAVGDTLSRKYDQDADFVIDAGRLVLLPGLVNTHTHAAMTLLRGYADDMPLQDWLTQKIWPLEAHLTGDDVYWGTRLACLEMIRTGTTAFNDMYFYMEDAARAVDEAGIKAQLCYGFIDLSLPDKREQEIKATERLVSHIKSMKNPRIRPAVGPHAVYTVSPEGLRWLAGYSSEQKIGIHVHLSETEKEVNDALSQYGKRPPQILADCGILTPGTVAAHCCWLDRDDCALLGRHGTYASYNPASNMKLAVNRALPYQDLRDAGVQVALGTDGCASNNNLDLFEEMKTAALLQKYSWNSQTLLPAPEALGMATSAGAKALGFGNGRIEAGQPADLILVDRDAVCNTPLHNLASNLVYACSGGAVRTVLCQGRVLMYDREVPGEEVVLAGASKAAHALVTRAAGT
ncbi:MAG: amidohydrolase family protein [Methanoregulaceae archaeon]|nr:amidohydrolase family protein [Methanoregulaceae archaeon]